MDRNQHCCNCVCRILMSASIGFNIQHHLPIPHSSYIPQVVKRSRVKAFGQIQSKCFPDSQDDATLESETHLQQPASIFLPSLSFLTKQDPFYAHPSIYMHPAVRSFATTMRSKIEEIDTRLQNIVTDKKDLELRENTGGTTRTTRSRVPTTSLVNEGRVYGRGKDKKAIVKLLLSGESSDAQLSVIPILGMGGLGKTTLAQLVYNDDEVSHYFDLKAWVCVSEEFDIIRVTKAILQSVTFEHCDANDLNLIQVKLKETLSGKKFLLILDDVWNEDYDDWTKLRCPFEFGAATLLFLSVSLSPSSLFGAQTSAAAAIL